MSSNINTQKPFIIEANKLGKKFLTAQVLKDIDFSVRAGEVVSIVGPSGSGKSTLLYCLAGILSVDSGKVLYKGNNLAKHSSNSLAKLRRTDFGFIFQFGELVPELPVLDNIALPLLLNGIKKRQAYEIAEKWARIVNIQSNINALPHTLSGGEMQRVAIARAMAIDPEIIFADEPTGSLDSKNATMVITLLITLAHKYNKTVIFVTHSKEMASRADRVVLLRDGEIEPSLVRNSQ